MNVNTYPTKAQMLKVLTAAVIQTVSFVLTFSMLLFVSEQGFDALLPWSIACFIFSINALLIHWGLSKPKQENQK